MSLALPCIGADKSRALFLKEFTFLGIIGDYKMHSICGSFESWTHSWICRQRNSVMLLCSVKIWFMKYTTSTFDLTIIPTQTAGCANLWPIAAKYEGDILPGQGRNHSFF